MAKTTSYTLPSSLQALEPVRHTKLMRFQTLAAIISDTRLQMSLYLRTLG